MKTLYSLVRKTIRRAIVIAGGLDNKDFPIQKVSYMGKTANVEIIFPYGMSANLSNDSLLVLLSLMGNSENKVAFGGDVKNRIKNLEQNEVVFYHPITKSKVYFKNNGDIDIESPTANVNINANQDISVTATNINLTGSVNITGDLDTQGNVTNTGTLTNNGVNVGSTHNHNYVNPLQAHGTQPGVSGGPQ